MSDFYHTLKSSEASQSQGVAMWARQLIADLNKNHKRSAAGSAWVSWTPTIFPTSGAFTTLGTLSGAYLKINKIVFIKLHIAITTNGTAAGRIQVRPLPIAPAASGALLPQVLNGYVDGTFKVLATILNPNNANGIEITNYDGTYPGADGANLSVSGFYEI